MKKIFFFGFTIIVLFTIVFISCRKPPLPDRISLDQSDVMLATNATLTLTATTTRSTGANSHEIITGASLTWTSSNPSVATVKDGVVSAKADGITIITVTVDGRSYVTTSCTVFVTSKTIYIAGGDGTLWKNGIEQQLTDGSKDATINSIYVYGNDVYMAGEKGNVATVWKNGIAQNLTNGSSRAVASSVFVSGNDVYVAGSEETTQDMYVAKLWKNGVAQNLSDGTYSAGASSVFVSGNDVYVAGGEDITQDMYVAKLWKNGVAQNLSDGTYRAWASSVFVSGNDVYVAGNKYNAEGVFFATLWKNGVAHNLTVYEWSFAYSVFVSGNDVYVGGSSLWKNGVEQNLTDISYKEILFVTDKNVYVLDEREGHVITSWGLKPAHKLWVNGNVINLPMSFTPRAIFVK